MCQVVYNIFFLTLNQLKELWTDPVRENLASIARSYRKIRPVQFYNISFVVVLGLTPMQKEVDVYCSHGQLYQHLQTTHFVVIYDPFLFTETRPSSNAWCEEYTNDDSNRFKLL